MFVESFHSRAAYAFFALACDVARVRGVEDDVALAAVRESRHAGCHVVDLEERQDGTCGNRLAPTR